MTIHRALLLLGAAMALLGCAWNMSNLVPVRYEIADQTYVVIADCVARGMRHALGAQEDLVVARYSDPDRVILRRITEGRTKSVTTFRDDGINTQMTALLSLFEVDAFGLAIAPYLDQCGAQYRRL